MNNSSNNNTESVSNKTTLAFFVLFTKKINFRKAVLSLIIKTAFSVKLLYTFRKGYQSSTDIIFSFTVQLCGRSSQTFFGV